MIGRILASLVACALALCAKDLYKFARAILHPLSSPLRHIPGPKPDGALLGNFKTLTETEPHALYEQWVEDYGHIFVFRAILNLDRLFLTDPRAVAHILRHPKEYPKPEVFRRSLSDMLGDGLLVAEEMHRRERRIMSPAFGVPQLRELTSVFFEKSKQLRDIWLQEIRSSSTTKKPLDPKYTFVEATQWFNKLTLDIIGLAGFNYPFNALNSEGAKNELNEAVRAMMLSSKPSFLDILHTFLPLTRVIPSEQSRRILHARKTMDRIGRELVADMKADVLSTAGDVEGVARKDFQHRDLLSLLVRANMAKDVPESGRLTDEEVIDQIPTFLFAGHETTSAALACTLYALSCNTMVQDALRAEVRSCADGETPSMETLNGLPYLDAVVHETLRLYPPVFVTIRDVAVDDVLPTEAEWVDRNGQKRDGVPVVAGDSIIIPILAMNRSKRIWGDDAYEFKPERWSNPPSAASAIPGVWGNSLSFLGGGRACIGYRFAVIEMKAVLYTLLRSFKFGLAVDSHDIQVRVEGITRPYLRDQVEQGPQLPLWIATVEP